jgi:DNA-binding IclR family transcriptional regulator
MKNKNSSLISLRRGIRVLEFVSLKPAGSTFGEIRNEFPDMTPATLARLLKSMLDEDLLSKNADGRNYQTGIKAKHLANTILGTVSKSEIIRPAVNELAEESGESALFTEYDNDAIRLLVKSEVADGFHYMDENNLNPNLSTHAFGITCLAFQPQETVKTMIDSKKMHGMSRKKYMETFEKIRSEEIFVNMSDDRKNLARITAPVFSGDKGEFAGVIGITFFSTGNDSRRISELVKKVSAAASKAGTLLGYSVTKLMKTERTVGVHPIVKNPSTGHRASSKKSKN